MARIRALVLTFYDWQDMTSGKRQEFAAELIQEDNFACEDVGETST